MSSNTESAALSASKDTPNRVEADPNVVESIATGAEAEAFTLPSHLSEELPSTSQVQLNINDSLAYLDAIRTRYESRPDVYQNFLELMKKFKLNQIDTLDVIENITHLFPDSPDLILAFNPFLPSTLRLRIQPPTEDNPVQASVEILTHNPSGDPHRVPVDLTEEDAKKLAVALREQAKNPPPSITVPVTAHPHADGINEGIAKTLKYMDKVKAKFDDGTDHNVYTRFLALLGKGNHGELDVVALQEQVEELFKDEPELLEGFYLFVPRTAVAAAA